MSWYHLSVSREPPLPSLTALRAFDLAAQLGSFKQAAAALGVTATAISHAVRGLEAELGQPLFERRTRAVALSPAGQALHASVREGFALLSAGVERVRAPARSPLTLSTTPAFAAKWLVPRLSRLHAAHPALELRIHASNEPVVLRRGVYDLAIRYGRASPHATPLFDDRFAVVASPSLRVRSIADVLRQPRIEFDWHRPLPRELTWRAWLRAAGASSSTPRGTRYSDESHAIQAAIAGQGVALLSDVLVRDELRLGTLRICPGPVLDGLGYYILRSDGDTSAASAAVERWLVEQSRKA